MSANGGKGIALKSVLWLLRGVQLGCAVIVLALYSYFLVTLKDHDLDISTNVRAVEGIAGAAVLYSLMGLLFLCCLAGMPVVSFIAMILDLTFACAYIFVAVANKGGASQCSGFVDTPYGNGKSEDQLSKGNKFTSLPSYHNACKMESACLAVSIVAIFFYIFSIITELYLARNRYRQRRFGNRDGGNYYGADPEAPRPGLFSRLFQRKHAAMVANDPNMLPHHPHPDQADHNRTSHATDTTAVGSPENSPYKYETGHGHDYSHVHDNKYHSAYGSNIGGTYQQNTPYQHQAVSPDHNGHNQSYVSGTTNPQHQATGALPTNYHYNDGVYDRP